MKTITLGFEFRARSPSFRLLREAIRMERESRAFEAQLQEVQRVFELSKDRLHALAERAREIGVQDD